MNCSKSLLPPAASSLVFRLLFSAVLSLNLISAFAQQDSIPKTKEHFLGIAVGSTNILDTYLSPENHTGTELRLVSSTLINKNAWSHLLQHEAYLSQVETRAKEGSELAGMYRFRYGLLHNIGLNLNGLRLNVGGQATANIGFLYNTRNQNNPAQGRLGLQVGPMARAKYHFSIFNFPFSLNYEASAPLVGLMFSPNYGQSYYEIFTRGNYDRNCVPTTIFSTPSLRHQLTLDFKVCGKTFAVGYLGDYDQYKVNNLKYHNYTHSLLIGYRY